RQPPKAGWKPGRRHGHHHPHPHKKRHRHYHYGYGWYDYYDYYDNYEYWSDYDAHVRWCKRRYRSYKVRTDSYLGYDGKRHRCVSPYDY
ncbi:MAG: BA14K family protein, partial [Rhizobiales bacterium]|nr:BA14K family protein [Hyphomicrobiales bacterium]